MNEAVKMPQHVAIIMDGNGRWAAQHKVSRLQGHNRGMLVMKEIIEKADVMGNPPPDRLRVFDRKLETLAGGGRRDF